MSLKFTEVEVEQIPPAIFVSGRGFVCPSCEQHTSKGSCLEEFGFYLVTQIYRCPCGILYKVTL